MQRKIVVNKGKKYIVNVIGWDDGVGPGAPVGTLWMQSTDGNWYSINASGSTGTGDLSVLVNQTSIGWQPPGPDYGYQLIACDDGHTYAVYLTGTSPLVTFTVSQSAYTGSSDPKPYFYFYSITDGNYYVVGLHNTSGSIQTTTNQGGPSTSSIVPWNQMITLYWNQLTTTPWDGLHV